MLGPQPLGPDENGTEAPRFLGRLRMCLFCFPSFLPERLSHAPAPQSVLPPSVQDWQAPRGGTYQMGGHVRLPSGVSSSKVVVPSFSVRRSPPSALRQVFISDSWNPFSSRQGALVCITWAADVEILHKHKYALVSKVILRSYQ